jgi:ATP phosphoribosyltransferase regulatory subunit
MTVELSSHPAALLPEGLRDVLAPQAEAEAALLRRLVDAMTAHGYERVAPPLVEFEDSLFGTHIEGAPRDVFRMMDPVSQRMLAVRADMTTQIARIAIDRLGHYARPLRLAYAGPVLRVRGSQLRADRQFQQAGAEFIGANDYRASAEVIVVACAAALAAGLSDVTLDLTMPDFVTLLAQEAGLDNLQTKSIRAALDGKDAAKLEVAAGKAYGFFAPLLEISGTAAQTLEKLHAHYHKYIAASRLSDMMQLVDLSQTRVQGIAFTLDPTEYHGFQYQTWFGFSLFARGVRGEVGRGGAYDITRSSGEIEKAVGFSVYLNGLVDAGAGVEPRQRLYVSMETDEAEAALLRQQGWVTVRAFSAVSDADARAQRCSHIYSNGAARAL